MTNEQTQRNFDNIYQNTSLDEIPWNHEQPPEVMVELLELGKVKPCRALDVGCGAGNYAIYLASKGFDVTAVDISPAGIEIAKQNAEAKNVKCQFLVADVVEEFPRFQEPFGFIYDWGLLHHIRPEDRRRYVHSLCDVLSDDGLYMSLCFNENDAYFEGTGKIRDTDRGTRIYLSTEDELKRLWQPYFEIVDFHIIDNMNYPIAHVFNFAVLKKKQ